ncbi:asparagine synthase C-terminal domain-containing protein [Trichothermofontia sichuanensis B231]|uniref:asparagine synthetase B family protein n=1 Tax=Trichothermofontia sichuanensis TaxID=3045816 RepID=UPI002245C4CA|nr:asparagine synthase C-terminal domain-containing protein [Trichothermofontia sichuanensis]UZQ55310.1 asparagine synthase C-terminal domain-containing protein [Trichothermofontia sichuanensis B231]
MQKYQYWQPNFTPHPFAISEAISTVREALLDSIQHHLVSDVPVGVFLSGGIDSSSIVALARQINTGKLKTYSIAFNETAYNEGKIAQKLASYFSTEHTQYKITASQAYSLIPKFLASIDQPTIDGFNIFCVSQLAHESGTKVVLSGLGGDELFAGYPSFQLIPKFIYFKRLLNTIKPLSFTIRKYFQYWGKTSKQRRIYDFLCNPTTSAANAYQLQRGIFSHSEACLLLQHYLSDQLLFKIPNNSVLLPKLPTQLPTLLDEISWIEMSCYMRNQLLRDSDVMSMAWGLELRVPFVDSVLLSTLIKIPSNLRLSLKKQLLIQAIPELPAWVTKRPKKAFTFPFEQWLEHDWKNDLTPIPHIPNVSLKPWYRYWSLVVLEAWLDLFFS